MKNLENLKAQFSALSQSKENFEGYILLSDKEPFILENKPLPDFDSLCGERSFIVEAALFCEASNECIAIRQINDSFLVQRICLDNYPHKDFEKFITINNKIAKIAQIWEEEIDLLCENLPVLKHKFSLFAGFESKESVQDIDKGGKNG